MNVKKSHGDVREGFALQMEVEMNGEIMMVLSLFKYWEGYFSRDGGLQEDVKMRVGEGLKTFEAMKMMFIVRSVS